METLPDHPIFKYNPYLMVTLRSRYNLDKPGDMDKAIDTLQEWLMQQEHITNKTFSREYLERAIITQKGSIERAKIMINKLCTIRTLLPSFFINNDFRDLHKDLEGSVIQVILPKQTKDNNRIYVVKVLRDGITTEMIFKGMQIGAILCDYFRAMDYSEGSVVIADLTGIDVVNVMRALNLADVRQAVSVFLDGFRLRLQEIYFISSSTAIDLFVTFMKSILKKKISDRIQVLKSVEELYEFVPKELLPVDFGGDEKSLEEILADWMDVLTSDKTLALLEDIRLNRTDERYRSTAEFNEHYMGIAGSFRTFTVD